MLHLIQSFRTVAAATLPQQGDEYESGDPAIVSGWGTLSAGGQSSDVLMKVEVPIVSDTGELTCSSGLSSLGAVDEEVTYGATAKGWTPAASYCLSHLSGTWWMGQ